MANQSSPSGNVKKATKEILDNSYKLSIIRQMSKLKKRGVMLRSKIFAMFLIGLLICLLASCATIVSGKYQTVTFNSEPQGAKVIVNGRTLGTTPLTLPLEKASNQTLSFEKEGYNTVTLPLTTTLNGWFWGNIVLGGLLGSTTDGLTGAVHEYSPSAL